MHVWGTGNRIEGNHAAFSDRVIDVDAASNTIVRNSSRASPIPFDIVPENDASPRPLVNSADVATSGNPHPAEVAQDAAVMDGGDHDDILVRERLSFMEHQAPRR